MLRYSVVVVPVSNTETNSLFGNVFHLTNWLQIVSKLSRHLPLERPVDILSSVQTTEISLMWL